MKLEAEMENPEIVILILINLCFVTSSLAVQEKIVRPMPQLNITAKQEIGDFQSTEYSTTNKAAYRDHFLELMSNKGFLGLDSGAVMGVFGPLALAAMVTLPFMAPAAAALLPLAGLSSVFGRRRRHLAEENESNLSKVPLSRRREWLKLEHQRRMDAIENENEKARRYLERQVERLLKKLNGAFKSLERKDEF